ncbi:BON domain-containing protein [Kingella kingae]|uniref:BON domain-containing protein n=1 Tax=Kingella kingae TaxID=504 RepID=UPI00254F3DF3|nr:BON domain-containing protein [Kingella kingae]MDK4650749.1 BON domain-containing protein [Kingella kingae]
MTTLPYRLTLVATVLTAIFVLNGCVAAALGTAAVGVNSIADRRSTGSQTDDEVMELRVKNNAMTAIKQINPQTTASVSVVSYNRKILLLGQVPTETERQAAEQVARSEKNQETVYNHIQLSSANRTLSNINYDTWITSKIRSRLFTVPDVYAGHVKVVTYNGITYLLGVLTPQQQAAVVERVNTTSGVHRVVTLFENYQPSSATQTSNTVQ